MFCPPCPQCLFYSLASHSVLPVVWAAALERFFAWDKRSSLTSQEYQSVWKRGPNTWLCLHHHHHMLASTKRKKKLLLEFTAGLKCMTNTAFSSINHAYILPSIYPLWGFATSLHLSYPKFAWIYSWCIVLPLALSVCQYAVLFFCALSSFLKSRQATTTTTTKSFLGGRINQQLQSNRVWNFCCIFCVFRASLVLAFVRGCNSGVQPTV